MLFASSLQAEDNLTKARLNPCVEAVEQLTDWRVKGVYGSPLEKEWHRTALYKLEKKMLRFDVLEEHVQEAAEDWQFERYKFTNKTEVIFVFHNILKHSQCKAMPNAFYVILGK